MRNPLVLLMLSAALLAGCGDSDDGDTTSTADTTAARAATTAGDTTQASTAEATPVPGEEATPSAATPPPPAEAGTRFTARVANGNVRGGPGEWKVSKGDRVTIVVESDEAEEIHVHGYDETADIEAGGSGEVTFTADLDGVFEVELEGSHLPVGTLQVNP